MASHPSQTVAGPGDPARLHVVQFADQAWSLSRQAISGGKEAATTALRARCRQMLQLTRLPDDTPEKAEIDFLGRLATCHPVDQQQGKWRLYQLDDAFPMVVGTQAVPEGTGQKTGQNLATTGHRVVTWGLAAPVGPDAWTLYTFQPGGSSDERFDIFPDIPLPPECRRVLSMRAAGGGVITAFQHAGQAKTTTDFYDRWFAGHDWLAVRKWRQSGSSWYARYVASEQDPALSAEVRFDTNPRGRCGGLLVITPLPPGREN